MRRAKAQTITFFAVDDVGAPARRSGLTLLTTDVWLSKNGGAFAHPGSAPVEIGSTGRYALALTAAETDCDWLHIYIEKSGMQPQDVLGSMSEQPSAAVVTGTSAGTFITNLSNAVDDFWKDVLVVFTTGALAGQVKKVSAYNGTTKALTFSSPFTAAPSAGDLFLIVNI